MSSYSITSDCIGCTLCTKNCPVNAISGKLKGQHAIDPEKCIRCGLCGRLCPRGAVRDENGAKTARIQKKDWKHPNIRKSECVGCAVCIEICPKDALALTAPHCHGDISVYAELVRAEDCIGCGLCARACPIDAITMLPPGETLPPP